VLTCSQVCDQGGLLKRPEIQQRLVRITWQIEVLGKSWLGLESGRFQLPKCPVRGFTTDFQQARFYLHMPEGVLCNNPLGLTEYLHRKTAIFKINDHGLQIIIKCHLVIEIAAMPISPFQAGYKSLRGMLLAEDIEVTRGDIDPQRDCTRQDRDIFHQGFVDF
jgi:hypothetical protein